MMSVPWWFPCRRCPGAWCPRALEGVVRHEPGEERVRVGVPMGPRRRSSHRRCSSSADARVRRCRSRRPVQSCRRCRAPHPFRRAAGAGRATRPGVRPCRVRRPRQPAERRGHRRCRRPRRPCQPWARRRSAPPRPSPPAPPRPASIAPPAPVAGASMAPPAPPIAPPAPPAPTSIAPPTPASCEPPVAAGPSIAGAPPVAASPPAPPFAVTFSQGGVVSTQPAESHRTGDQGRAQCWQPWNNHGAFRSHADVTFYPITTAPRASVRPGGAVVPGRVDSRIARPRPRQPVRYGPANWYRAWISVADSARL